MITKKLNKSALTIAIAACYKPSQFNSYINTDDVAKQNENARIKFGVDAQQICNAVSMLDDVEDFIFDTEYTSVMETKVIKRYFKMLPSVTYSCEITAIDQDSVPLLELSSNNISSEDNGWYFTYYKMDRLDNPEHIAQATYTEFLQQETQIDTYQTSVVG